MKQFAALYGGRAETIEGLAGLGDLLVTAMSPLSRNRQAGTYLAQGYPKEQIVHELMRMEVESFNVLEKLSLPQKADQYFPLLSTVQNIYRGNISKEEIPIALAFLV
jgi:glycerol-3-phosphate dehydrogenase (NAD(P)+)